jgi:cyclin-dependent kinase 2
LGGKQYSTPVDVWSIGCIFAEMVRGEALFRGDSEIGQLMSIFHVLGTPNERNWAGVSNLPDYKGKIFPQWEGEGLEKKCPTMCPMGIDLIKRMLAYEPAKRISAREALKHPYFNDLARHMASSSSTTSTVHSSPVYTGTTMAPGEIVTPPQRV